jgi:transposase
LAIAVSFAWPEALQRQMMAETREPGASASIEARRHDANTNHLFKWRRELLPKAVSAVVCKRLLANLYAPTSAVFRVIIPRAFSILKR